MSLESGPHDAPPTAGGAPEPRFTLRDAALQVRDRFCDVIALRPYHQLVLVVGALESGKTTALRAASEGTRAHVGPGAALGQRLLPCLGFRLDEAWIVQRGRLLHDRTQQPSGYRGIEHLPGSH